MPARYEIDEALGCVFSSASGRVSDQDLLDHQRRLPRDRRFKPDLRQLYDFRGLEGINVTLQAVRELARNNPYGPGARRAFVVDSTLALALATMFQALAQAPSHKLEIYREIGEARAWLQIEEFT